MGKKQEILEPKPFKPFIEKDLYRYFEHLFVAICAYYTNIKDVVFVQKLL